MPLSGRVTHTRRSSPIPKGTAFLDDLTTDLGLAFRRLVKTPGFSLTAILILAIGIGATVAMVSVLDETLRGAFPFPEPQELVLGRATFNGELNPAVSYPDYLDFQSEAVAFESLSLVRTGSQRHTVSGSGPAERIQGLWVSSGLFSTLAAEPLLGRFFSLAEGQPSGPPAGIISHRFWQRRFAGDPTAVGRTMTVDGAPITVIGVMSPSFRFHQDVDLWLPIKEGILDTGMRDSHSWLIVGRLGQTASLEEAQTQVDVVARRLAEAYPGTHEGKGLLLSPLSSSLSEPYRGTLMVLMGATALLLIIACGNVASLLLARSASRRGDYSLRAALGASRGRITRQLLTESLALALVSGAVGVFMALAIQRMVLGFLPLGVMADQNAGLSAAALAAAFLISLTTAMVSGAGPALVGSRANPARNLMGSRRATGGGPAGHARKGMVVGQVALSALLLSASALLVVSLTRLMDTDLGFDPEGVLTADLPLPESKYPDAAARERFFRQFLDEVESLPGVQAASVVNMVPILHRYQNWGAFDLENPPANREEGMSAYARSVMPGYFEVMGIPLLDGRDHQHIEATSEHGPLVISQEMANRLFPNQNPLGRQVGIGSVENPWIRVVVGVVADIRMTTVDAEPFPQMYFHYPGLAYPTMQLVVRSEGDPAALTPSIRRVLSRMDPDIPLNQVSTMSEVVSNSLARNGVMATMIALFSAVAVLLSAVGLHGFLTFSVSQRTQEIGIRMAVGADPGGIVQMILRQGLTLVGLGLAIGVGASLTSTRVLGAFLYGIEPTDPGIHLSVVVLFLLVGALASVVPASLATRIDPVRAFQSE